MTFGFIGAAYTGRAKVAAAERCINLFPEKVETAEGKSPAVLLGTPGLSLFCTLAAGVPSVRGIWTEPASLRTFAVASNVFYEVFSNGTFSARGTMNELAGSSSPVTMRSNGTQLVVSSLNAGYLFTLATNTFQQLNTANFPFVSNNQPGASGFPGAAEFELLDTYLIALNPGTRQFFLSLVNDATDWSALQFASKDSWPDNLVSMLMNKRELWLMGSQRGEVWWDAGNPNFPFERIQGASIETGCEAAMSLQRADGGISWLGRSELGPGIAYRNNGYEAVRISTHGTEYEWGKYALRSDAEAFTYQEGGHTFWVLNFPSADATWVYDYSTGLWHQRAWWDPVNGGFHAHLARNHTYNFGKHLVGDRKSGNIYVQSLDTYTDNGNPVRRLRSCSVFQERKWIYYKQLDIYALTGQADGVEGAGTEPLASLRLSDDGGMTWGNPLDVPLGYDAQYGYRWMWRNLGRSRDRVFEWSTSEPIPIAIVDAYLDGGPGSGA